MALVIPVFIPHQGCPHQCSFCNQQSITGVQGATVREDIKETISTWLGRPRKAGEVQVAFYGGSFTCIAPETQEEMLGAVQPFIRAGQVHSLRLSTRPDCIDDEIVARLGCYGVKTVELGVQSLDDDVLQQSLRGHTAEDSRKAVRLLKHNNLQVGMQLMPGLPGDRTRTFLQTVRETIDLAPAFVRIYPVLVLTNSPLAAMYHAKNYLPLSMNRAIGLAARAKVMFDEAVIAVVRMGLQPSPSLERELVAGPYHPAFGELVAARLWLNRIRTLFVGLAASAVLEITISHRDLSAVIGPRRINMQRLHQLYGKERLVIHTQKDMKRGSLHHVVR